jgi:uncharacterized protein (TIGR03067 family)
MSALTMILMAGMLRDAGVPIMDSRAAQEQVIPPDRKWVEKNNGWVWEFRKGGKLLTSYPDGNKDSSRYVLRPKRNPAQIDIITIDGRALGIYRLKGDTLEICWACPGVERPTKFAPGNGEDDAIVLSVLKRAK